MAVRIADTLKQQNDLTSFPVAYGSDIWLDKNKGVGTADYSDLQTMYNSDELGGSSIQVDELPIASSEESGKIYQYVGVSGTYTKGFFYECKNYGYLCWTVENSSYYTKSTETDVEEKVYIKNGELYEEVGVIVKIINNTLTFKDDNENEITLNRYSDGDITNVGYEWTSINVENGTTVVEEVDSLPQTLGKKIYNVTNSTVYSGSSCSVAMSELQSNFSKNISVLYKKTTSGNVITQEWRYNVLSGTLTYGDDAITKVIVVQENETTSRLYNGDTQVEYLADDYMSFNLTYVIDEVYSKNIKLATAIDLPTIDQNYNADSPNAQSGVAVASAISSATEDCVKTSGNQEINGHKTFNGGIIADTIISSGEGVHGSINITTNSYMSIVEIEAPGDNSDASINVVGGNNNESYVNMTADLVKANNKNVVTSVNSTQADNSGNVSVDVGVTSVNGSTGAVTLSIPTITVSGNTATITY